MGPLMSYMGGTGFGLATQATTIITGALYDRFLQWQIQDFDSFHAAILDIFSAINMALPGKHYDAPTHTQIEKFYEQWKPKNDDEKKKNFIEFVNKIVNLSKADESTHTKIEKFYEEWKSKDDDEKKKNFIEFMSKNVHLRTADESTRIVFEKFYEEWKSKDDDEKKKNFIEFMSKYVNLRTADESTHTVIEKLYEEWKPNDDGKKKNFIEFMNKNVNLSKADESMMITGILAPPAAMVAKKTGQSLPQLSVIKSIPDVAFVPTATILTLIAIKLTKRMSFKNLPS